MTKHIAPILPIVACFALSNVAQAVNPSPDGGYPGFNTASGQKALFSLTTGVANTANGWFSLWSNSDGSFNTGVGAATLLFNVGNQSTGEGVENTAIGAAALLFNNVGSANTAVGLAALESNTTGSGNIASGANALQSNTTGSNNTATGTIALLSNSTGNENTAVGWGALASNTADANTAVGNGALLNNTTGGTLGTIIGYDMGPNTAVGSQALQSNTITGANTAVGYQALQNLTTGPAGFEGFGANTAVGFQALGNTTNSFSCGFGYQAMFNNTDGYNNVAIGPQSLFSNQTGYDNTALGEDAGYDITGNGNVCIGAEILGVSGENYTTRIANIGNSPQGGGLTVTVEGINGTKLGYVPSSRRYKEDITPMDRASEAILSLKPVSFRYKKSVDPAQMRAFGLIAEDVAKVDPDLVARNPQGQPESVRYEYINAMLLNEFLKEHRAVQQQGATIARLEKQIEELTAGLQRVSAQRELAKAEPQMVGNDH